MESWKKTHSLAFSGNRYDEVFRASLLEALRRQILALAAALVARPVWVWLSGPAEKPGSRTDSRARWVRSG